MTDMEVGEKMGYLGWGARRTQKVPVSGRRGEKACPRGTLFRGDTLGEKVP